MFNTALSATNNVDTLGNYSAATCTIDLAASIFAKLGAPGALNAAFFHSGLAAADANDYIVYDNVTGKLYYDADGNGAAAKIQFAVIANHAVLTNADFVVI